MSHIFSTRYFLSCLSIQEDADYVAIHGIHIGKEYFFPEPSLLHACMWLPLYIVDPTLNVKEILLDSCAPKMLQQSFLMLLNLPHGTYPSHDTFVLSKQLRQPH